jgi:hypothetical protein
VKRTLVDRGVFKRAAGCYVCPTCGLSHAATAPCAQAAQETLRALIRRAGSPFRCDCSRVVFLLKGVIYEDTGLEHYQVCTAFREKAREIEKVNA